MPDCERTIPSGSDDEITAMTANYPESWDEFGRLHDIQFPYWHVCQAIGTLRDIAGMLKSDMDKRGDVDEPGTMVETMTRDGAGGWRSGNAETIGFDATWAGIRASLLGDGFSPGLIKTLENVADDLDQAWTDVNNANDAISENRADYDAWFDARPPADDLSAG